MDTTTREARAPATYLPRTGETPIRHVRVSDKFWDEIGEIAREQGRSVSAVVLDALSRYVAWYRRQRVRSND